MLTSTASVPITIEFDLNATPAVGCEDQGVVQELFDLTLNLTVPAAVEG